MCAPFKVYNIGNNNPVKLMDFISEIEYAYGKKLKIDYKKLQPGDVPGTYADVNDLISDFDYKPKTKIGDGVKKFIEWYKEYYNLNE